VAGTIEWHPPGRGSAARAVDRQAGQAGRHAPRRRAREGGGDGAAACGQAGAAQGALAGRPAAEGEERPGSRRRGSADEASRSASGRRGRGGPGAQGPRGRRCHRITPGRRTGEAADGREVLARCDAGVGDSRAKWGCCERHAQTELWAMLDDVSQPVEPQRAEAVTKRETLVSLAYDRKEAARKAARNRNRAT